MPEDPSTQEVEPPTGRQILRATLLAMIAAILILVSIVLPSEYGIRPSELGRLFGIGGPGTAETVAASATELGAGRRRDELTIMLRPEQSAEVKLAMRAGAKAEYTWSTTGGGVNFNTHADPDMPSQSGSHRYNSGQQTARDTGTLEAAFDGQHGWYWKNRTDQNVMLTLRTEGEYRELKRVF